jgi:hypothetical protein
MVEQFKLFIAISANKKTSIAPNPAVRYGKQQEPQIFQHFPEAKMKLRFCPEYSCRLDN